MRPSVPVALPQEKRDGTTSQKPQSHRRKGDAGRCQRAVRRPPGLRWGAKTAGLALIAVGLPHHGAAVGVVNRERKGGRLLFRSAASHPATEEPQSSLFPCRSGAADGTVHPLSMGVERDPGGVVMDRRRFAYQVTVEVTAAVLAFPARVATSAPRSSDSLIAHWSFDNCDAVDVSGNGRTGTVVGQPQCVDGQWGTALRFQSHGYADTAGDHVLIPSIDFRPMTGLSVCLWVAEESLLDNDGEAYISFGDHTDGFLYIAHFFDNLQFGFGVLYDGSLIRISFDATSDKGRYVFYCMTYANRVLKAYKDGVLIGSRPAGPVPRLPSTSAIARHWWYSGRVTSSRFTGSIDDVRIYSRALTDGEVRTLAGTPSPPACGDGHVQADQGEECDGANTNPDDGCTTSCTVCGNAIVSSPEQCDDGNLINGDGCDANCTLPMCGNGIVDVGEDCDDANSDDTDGCINSCTICGNGIVTPPEQCDDANREPSDTCSNACTICGNGIVTPPEECDDGGESATCGTDCTLPQCGDGARNVTAGEQCDDGNTRSCDGCSARCRREVGVTCGDGSVSQDCGEQCDDGNGFDGDGCDTNCTPTACGNGVRATGEQCDDGNRTPSDGCTTACTICGDGVVTPPEECDDGNLNPADGCTSACTRCGNGIVTPPEGCDDGNLINGDGCEDFCAQPGCGNATVDGDEECDDGGICIGSTNAGTFCTASAQCPGGRCKTFGGDSCGANCTLERNIPFDLVPGQRDGIDIAVGTSGAGLYTDILLGPLPFSGSQTLTIGKERDGQIPVVIKAGSVRLARVPISGGMYVPSSCFCPRAVAAKTCGGTEFEPDGVTPATDCTAGFTGGDSVCAGRKPCAFVHGPGNSAAGVIRCDGLDDVNVQLTQDAGGSSGIPRPPVLTASGTGGSGSALLSASTAVGGGVGLGDCTGQNVSTYGLDGEFCTDDDPQAQRGTPVTALVTTGTATGQVLNANAIDANNVGPFSVTGARFRCSGLDASGAALASTFAELARPDLGDTLFTSVLVASSAASECVGDCDADGPVTANELVTLVNVALDKAQTSACAHGVPLDREVDITLILQAVNSALTGCGDG